MWFVYLVLFLGAVASVVNAAILIALATLAVRLLDRLNPKPRKKKRRRGQMIEGDGLVDVETPLLTYDVPPDVAQPRDRG